MKKSNKNRVCKKDYMWNPSESAREVNRYLKIIADDLVITMCHYAV